MATTSLYSFSDVAFAINHPNVGKLVINGKGADSIQISRASDQTQHDIAADGSVMISKVVTKNGSVSISMQQTSEAHKWFLKWYKYCLAHTVAQWANCNAYLEFKNNGEKINMNGISPQKRPDASFQAAGQKVTWTLMVAEITE